MAVSPVCELMIRSGLRISEVLDNTARCTKTTVKFRLNKKVSNEFHDIKIIGPVSEWVEMYKKMKADFKGRDSKAVTDSINLKLKKILPADFYKRSSHICRAIYVRYLYKFKAGEIAKWTFPQIITKFLHHDNTAASSYYQHVILDKDVTNFLNAKPKGAAPEGVQKK